MGKELATLFSIDSGNDWLITTPEGYFSSSFAGAKYVCWRVGEEVYPVEQYEEQFRRPDLIKLKGTWNFTVIPEIQMGEVKVKDHDALAIPGGFEKAGFYEDAYSEDFLGLIRNFDKEKKIIALICVGLYHLEKAAF